MPWGWSHFAQQLFAILRTASGQRGWGFDIVSQQTSALDKLKYKERAQQGYRHHFTLCRISEGFTVLLHTHTMGHGLPKHLWRDCKTAKTKQKKRQEKNLCEIYSYTSATFWLISYIKAWNTSQPISDWLITKMSPSTSVHKWSDHWERWTDEPPGFWNVMNMERHKPNPRQHHFLLSKGCSYVAHLKSSSLRILSHASISNTDLRLLCFTASCFQKQRKLGRYVVGKMTA